jgi:hypothetical protein
MSGGPRKTKDSTLKPICFEKGLKWGSGFEKSLFRPCAGYSLLKPRHFENQATEHDNRIINM